MHNSRRDFFRLAIAAPFAGAVATTAPQTEERAELEPYEYGRHERPLREAQADMATVARPRRWVSNTPPMPKEKVLALWEEWEGKRYG